MNIKKTLFLVGFYFLSFTWGALVSVAGLLVAIVLLLCGNRIESWNHILYIEVKRASGNWGLNLGPISFISSVPSTETKEEYFPRVLPHEGFGHGVQNCIFGPFMVFIVCLPSVIRFWIRDIKMRKGEKLPPYDSVWFEGNATKTGKKIVAWLKND